MKKQLRGKIMHRDIEVAQRYAKALFELCLAGADTNLAEPTLVLEELKSFNQVLELQPQLKSFFLNPVISKDDKLDVLGAVEGHYKRSFRFLSVVVESDRIQVLNEMISVFEKFLEEHLGEMSVQLEVARPISESLQQSIRSFLEAQWKKRVKLMLKEDPELIGGFIARAPGRTLDGSVRTQLQRLKYDVVN